MAIAPSVEADEGSPPSCWLICLIRSGVFCPPVAAVSRPGSAPRLEISCTAAAGPRISHGPRCVVT